MKIRILDRILVAVAGMILLAVCSGLVAQAFFGVDLLGRVSNLLERESMPIRIAAGAAAAFLLILGIYCVLVLFRHRKRKDGFVLQKMENGDLAISLKTLETMVDKCVRQHSEIQTESIQLDNQRDGLLVRIRGTVAGGISIPLTVDTLQKQVKQYVTACSGVDVKGIRVQIESSGEDAPDAPFAIAPPELKPLLNSTAETEADPSPAETVSAPVPPPVPETEGPAAEAVPETPDMMAAEAAMAAAETLRKEYGETDDDDRPIHQRLFSSREEPCVMPMPPLTSEEADGEEAGRNATDSSDDVSEPDSGSKDDEEEQKNEQ